MTDQPDPGQPEQPAGDGHSKPPSVVQCRIELDVDRLRWIHAQAGNAELSESERREAVQQVLMCFPFLLSSLAVWHSSCQQAFRELEQTQQELEELRHSRTEWAAQRSTN